MRKIARERQVKNFEAKSEMIDVLEVVEVKQEADYEELEGIPMLRKFESVEPSLMNTPKGKSHYELLYPEKKPL